jgi:hypothetical protein
MHPDDGVTVGTEAMSDAARPRPITARMVEEGRDRKREAEERKVAYVEDLYVTRFVQEVAWLEAVDGDRHQYAVIGTLVDDGEPRRNDGPQTSGAYGGSAMPLEGVGCKLTDMSLKARRCLQAIREILAEEADDEL